MEQLKAKFETDPNGLANMTSPLRNSDFALIGKLVQVYCYADLNARRIIDVIKFELSGPTASRASLLDDASALKYLRTTVADHLPSGNLKEGVLKSLDTIEMHREHRQNFAHWGARRLKGADALILFSRREKGPKAAPLPHDQLRFGIAPLSALKAELLKLEGHAEYLAHAAAQIDSRREELRTILKRPVVGGRRKKPPTSA